MEPRIQYAKTADGVSIAFSTLGEGMPLVNIAPTVWGHLQIEWQNVGMRSWAELLAQNRRVIRYDHRGSGLSDRNVADISLDRFALDLEAVVDHLHLERFALMAGAYSGPVAIAFASRHPERVSHLVLWCAWDGASSAPISQEHEATRVLIQHNWELYTETAAHVLVGWEAGELARWLAALIRESVTPEAYQAYHDARTGFDVTDLLPNIRCPTLVLHRREVFWPPLDVARSLASHIPDARLVLLEGTSVAQFVGDTKVAAAAIDEFLGEGEETPAATEAPAAGAVHTILFTDVAGSTALTQRLGDAKARELLREHERTLLSPKKV